MEILNIAIPAALVFLTAYLLLDKMFKNEEKRRIFEFKKQNLSTITPVRLRAYERLALFLERTIPNSLVINVTEAGMNCMQLHAKLLESIRQEYSHNVSQQIYVSDDLWENIVAAKESLVQLVNTCAASCKPEAPATMLAEKVLQVYAASPSTPSEIALAKLKEEIRSSY